MRILLVIMVCLLAALTVSLKIPIAKLDSKISNAMVGEVQAKKFPYTPYDLTPEDPGNDQLFYLWPKFVHHADEGARRQLCTAYKAIFSHYKDTRGAPIDVLDLCSSFTSHYPSKKELKELVGDVTVLGLNWAELFVNPSRTLPPVLQDLNQNTVLPFSDESFDVVTLSLSVDYLTSPLEAFREMRRVLKPGGLAAMAFTNRCFPSKVIPRWLMPFDDASHARIVYNYFYYCQGWDNIEILDVSEDGMKGKYNPMVIVQARRK